MSTAEGQKTAERAISLRRRRLAFASFVLLFSGGLPPLLPLKVPAPAETCSHDKVAPDCVAHHTGTGKPEDRSRHSQKKRQKLPPDRVRADEEVTQKDVDEVISLLLKSIPTLGVGERVGANRQSLIVLETCEESRAAIPALIKLLKDKDSKVACDAAYALSRLGKYAEKAIPELIDALANRKGTDRIIMAHALSSMGRSAKPATPILRGALHDPILPVRVWAARAIAKLEDPSKQALPVLRECLVKEKEEEDLQDILFVLREIGPPAKIAIPELKRLLKFSKASSSLKQSVAETLLAIDGQQRDATKWLLGIFRSRDGNVWDWVRAGTALARVKKYEPEVRAATLRAIQAGTAEDQRAVSTYIGSLPVSVEWKLTILRHALKDNGMPARALATAGDLGAAAVPLLPQLRGFVRDENPLIRLQAKIAIRAIRRDVPLR